MLKIILLGKVDPRIVDCALRSLSMYGVRPSLERPLPLPDSAFSVFRKQYNADELLCRIQADGPLIALIAEDIYAGKLNYTFSRVFPDEKKAVVSFARFDPSFFGRPHNERLLFDRLVKEIRKVFGAISGIEPHEGCVMEDSPTIPAVDAKMPGFCSECVSKIGEDVKYAKKEERRRGALDSIFGC